MTEYCYGSECAGCLDLHELHIVLTFLLWDTEVAKVTSEFADEDGFLLLFGAFGGHYRKDLPDMDEDKRHSLQDLRCLDPQGRCRRMCIICLPGS